MEASAHTPVFSQLLTTIAETLCMKGLILTHMGRRDEGIELVKKGVRLDLTSHIVWHVFGLIQKGEKNYEEALKSYTQALKFDKVHFRSLLHWIMSEICLSKGEYEHSSRCCKSSDSAASV